MLFDGFSRGRCLDSGSGSGGRTRCLFQFPLPLTFAHALPLTDLQWAMPVQVVSCTQFTQPRVSTMYTLDPRPPPTQPLRPPPHVPRRPSSNNRMSGSLSLSLACPLSLLNTTNSSSVTPEHVRQYPCSGWVPYSLLSLFLALFFSINTHLHSPQGRRRWIVRNGVVV